MIQSEMDCDGVSENLRFCVRRWNYSPEVGLVLLSLREEDILRRNRGTPPRQGELPRLNSQHSRRTFSFVPPLHFTSIPSCPL
jgi:hypothetical protein